MSFLRNKSAYFLSLFALSVWGGGGDVGRWLDAFPESSKVQMKDFAEFIDRSLESMGLAKTANLVDIAEALPEEEGRVDALAIGRLKEAAAKESLSLADSVELANSLGFLFNRYGKTGRIIWGRLVIQGGRVNLEPNQLPIPNIEEVLVEGLATGDGSGGRIDRWVRETFGFLDFRSTFSNVLTPEHERVLALAIQIDESLGEDSGRAIMVRSLIEGILVAYEKHGSNSADGSFHRTFELNFFFLRANLAQVTCRDFVDSAAKPFRH